MNSLAMALAFVFAMLGMIWTIIAFDEIAQTKRPRDYSVIALRCFNASLMFATTAFLIYASD